MKQLPFVRSVALVCHILFSIFRVLAVIGAVGILIGIFTLSFLPKNTITVDSFTEMTMRFHLRSLVDDETWNLVKDELRKSLSEDAQISEDGSMIITESEPSQTLENRTMSLSLVPLFAELLASIAFFHFMARLFKILREMTITPFSREAAKEMKSSALSLFALAAVPVATSFLISLFTGVENLGASLETDLILWGFVLLALSYIFEFGATLAPFSFSYQTPENPPSNENSQHPNAF